MRTVLVTGFPGFLGSELVRRILARDAAAEVVCLVQAKFADLAGERADAIESEDEGFAGRVRLAEGDITRPGLGLEAGLVRGAREIYHLAAVYDLAVKRELAMKINVEGTRHVLDVAARAARLDRFHYVSTCYVSGRWAGIFRESDLEKGQRFNNFYEETKYLAEIEVRRRQEAGLPVTTYRPGVVVGDSRTGETRKFDGPYFITRWLMKQPSVAVLPVPLGTSDFRVNLVPRDFVIDAIDALAGWDGSRGVTYQLADPDPPTIDETITLMGEATGRAIVRTPLPLGVAKAALDWVPGVEWVMGIPSPAIDYFAHPTHYDTTNATRDLAALGIRCPRLADYFHLLVGFQQRHPEIGSAAMV